MPDPIIQNNDTRSLIVFGATYEPDTLTAAGALTYAEGTVLGRITASGKLTHYASGAVDGSEVPVAVLRNETVFAGAGDKPIQALISGQVHRDKLVAHGVGAITVAEADALRDLTIISRTSRELGELDNQ